MFEKLLIALGLKKPKPVKKTAKPTVKKQIVKKATTRTVAKKTTAPKK